MFAVIEIAGKQYKVQEKDVFDVPHIEESIGKTVIIDKILMISGDKTVKIGTPYVDKAKVTFKVISQHKGEKINVRRYKSKVRYRKSTGFRPQLTRIEIISIGQK
jgi:large subunit ribosomal protein L21